jgi:transcriptional regulator with XRE-family HTH domain
MKKGEVLKEIRKLRYWKITNKRLYAAIRETGLALSECARIIGVSLRTLERWLFDGITPKPENQVKAAGAFHKEPDELF